MDQHQQQKRSLRGVAAACAVALAVGTVITLVTVSARGPADAATQVTGMAVSPSSIPGSPVDQSPAPDPAPTTSDDATSTPAETATETPSSELVAAAAAEPASASSPESTATIPAIEIADPTTPISSGAPSIESLINGRQMYATGTVNVRDARGTEGTTIVDGLSGGEAVTAGDTVDGWVPVHAGDTFGWVSADYLADGTPPTVAAQPAAEPEPADPASSSNWMEQLIPQVDPGGEANWVFERNHAWGASDGHTNYIDPDVPADKRFSVMVHEFSHVKQVEVYGSLGNSIAALSAINGGSPSDNSANESTADCMALMLGATWVDYGCQDSLRDAAAAILAGRRP